MARARKFYSARRPGAERSEEPGTYEHRRMVFSRPVFMDSGFAGLRPRPGTTMELIERC